MAVENKYGSLVGTNINDGTVVDSSLLGGRPRVCVDTVEVSASASISSTYTFARIPVNSVVLPSSKLYFDALATSGITLDIGFKAVNSNITTDDDILHTGIATTAANTDGKGIIVDPSKSGKRVWEHLGLTADPGGVVDVIATIRGGAAGAGGTVTMELFYTD